MNAKRTGLPVSSKAKRSKPTDKLVTPKKRWIRRWKAEIQHIMATERSQMQQEDKETGSSRDGDAPTAAGATTAPQVPSKPPTGSTVRAPNKGNKPVHATKSKPSTPPMSDLPVDHLPLEENRSKKHTTPKLLPMEEASKSPHRELQPKHDQQMGSEPDKEPLEETTPQLHNPTSKEKPKNRMDIVDIITHETDEEHDKPPTPTQPMPVSERPVSEQEQSVKMTMEQPDKNAVEDTQQGAEPAESKPSTDSVSFAALDRDAEERNTQPSNAAALSESSPSTQVGPVESPKADSTAAVVPVDATAGKREPSTEPKKDQKDQKENKTMDDPSEAASDQSEKKSVEKAVSQAETTHGQSQAEVRAPVNVDTQKQPAVGAVESQMSPGQTSTNPAKGLSVSPPAKTIDNDPPITDKTQSERKRKASRVQNENVQSNEECEEGQEMEETSSATRIEKAPPLEKQDKPQASTDANGRPYRKRRRKSNWDVGDPRMGGGEANQSQSNAPPPLYQNSSQSNRSGNSSNNNNNSGHGQPWRRNHSNSNQGQPSFPPRASFHGNNNNGNGGGRKFYHSHSLPADRSRNQGGRWSFSRQYR